MTAIAGCTTCVKQVCRHSEFVLHVYSVLVIPITSSNKISMAVFVTPYFSKIFRGLIILQLPEEVQLKLRTSALNAIIIHFHNFNILKYRNEQLGYLSLLIYEIKVC